MLILSRPYFLIIQAIVIVIFILLNKVKKQDEYSMFPSKYHFSVIMIAAILTAYFFNINHQIYCIPVLWAKVTLIVFSIYVIGNWLFKKILGESFNVIILGFGLFLSFYLILFGGIEYFFFVLIQSVVYIPLYILSKALNKKYNVRIFDFLNLFGLTILLPIVFPVWIFKYVSRNVSTNKYLFLSLPVILFVLSISVSIRINGIIEQIDISKDKAATIQIIIKNPSDAYLTELILGAHWKYHTRVCTVDGWRPPYHNPILGIAKPILYFFSPFHENLELERRIEYYKIAFPNNKYEFQCKCAKHERLL